MAKICPTRSFRNTEKATKLMYDKDRLLANGERWERAIAANLAADAPYR